MTRDRLADRDAAAFWFSALCACAGILIWTLWVLPVSASVAQADPQPLGRTAEIDLGAGERIGVWGGGISAMLGTMECAVIGPDDIELPQRGGPSLSWDDTLWWMTPRHGFEQRAQFTSVEAGLHTVTCTDALDTYDGEFLLAGDVFGTGSIGLGRNGASDFAVGTLLAVGAVFCPLIVVLVPGVIGIRRLVSRRRRARRAGDADAPWTSSLEV
ncbi:hypothetical protein [Microbacterium sp. MYb62]|uniref:hypothetical protein n=1 Tax=Microbacterium sp. MYb62 TaxID=1848690 RepID=UPI000CFD52FC|nr:hypothetical protein [Microbacterium sp. MYb62]PRB15188.1 hypothetical protein CQ042_09605 [Microbacterium sp. MYb62]